MNQQEITELKQYFFAMYIGQKVMKWHNPQPPEDTQFTEIITGSMLEAFGHECYLHLRPLSSITDQEAIEVAKILKPNEVQHHDAKAGRYYIKGLDSTMHTWPKYIMLYQYLQQQSFALPIYFKGVQYSVERIQELGIITLK